MEEFLQYYGLDWLAMVLSLLAVFLIGNKIRIGFFIFAAANLLWIALGATWMSSLGIVVGNLVLLYLNLRWLFNGFGSGVPRN